MATYTATMTKADKYRSLQILSTFIRYGNRALCRNRCRRQNTPACTSHMIPGENRVLPARCRRYVSEQVSSAATLLNTKAINAPGLNPTLSNKCWRPPGYEGADYGSTWPTEPVCRTPVVVSESVVLVPFPDLIINLAIYGVDTGQYQNKSIRAME